MLINYYEAQIMKYLKSLLSRVVQRQTDIACAKLSLNHIKINSEQLLIIEKTIRQNYHTGWRSEKNYTEDAYKKDLSAHLSGRLENDRAKIVPWLDDARPLRGQHILEIGCGTGSSAIALAEQGAKLLGVDIDEGALCVAKDRANVYGVEAEFRLLNATEIRTALSGKTFDTIIFFASLEHMTIDERLTSLKDAWEMLRENGLLVAIETPNRLWYKDGHTSLLPFFHWLPDQLAFHYAKYSPRENFCDLYGEYTDVARQHFLRRGRGVSFHEFDLAIRPARELNIVSSLSTYNKKCQDLNVSDLNERYKTVLKEIYPGIHDGFFDENLFIVIKKN